MQNLQVFTFCFNITCVFDDVTDKKNWVLTNLHGRNWTEKNDASKTSLIEWEAKKLWKKLRKDCCNEVNALSLHKICPRLNSIRKVQAGETKILETRIIKKPFDKFHIDANSPGDKKYWAYQAFEDYYKLPDDIEIIVKK